MVNDDNPTSRLLLKEAYSSSGNFLKSAFEV
jgi:hypothetical protein